MTGCFWMPTSSRDERNRRRLPGQSCPASRRWYSADRRRRSRHRLPQLPRRNRGQYGKQQRRSRGRPPLPQRRSREKHLPQPGHVADTEKNRPFERRAENIRFFRTGDVAIPRRAGAGWLVVDRRRFDIVPQLDSVYRDSRYTLYVVP